MSQHADILDQHEPMRGAFIAAISLHAAILLSFFVSGWLAGHSESFGAQDPSGAVGIEAVNSIPLPSHGPQNPLANNTESTVPQTPTKPVEKPKVEPPPPPDAVALNRRTRKLPPQDASVKQRFRNYDQLMNNQLTTKTAPAVSSPLFAQKPGAGQVGTGANTTLGNRFAGYAAQIQQLVAQHWRTADVDARLQTAPPVIATFDLMRDGSIRNVRLLQTSNIPSLDASVQRAILDASPFPPIPAGYDKDYAKVEFIFELKR
jgi:TonB family protein